MFDIIHSLSPQGLVGVIYDYLDGMEKVGAFEWRYAQEDAQAIRDALPEYQPIGLEAMLETLKWLLEKENTGNET